MSALTISTDTVPVPKISSGGAEVIAAGTVHTFTPSDITIQLQDLTFRFTFIADGSGNRIEATPAGTKEIGYRLYNFHNALGTGLSEPLKVGKLRGKDLYFCLTVYAHSETVAKVVHYTFFLKEAPNA